LDLVLAGSSDQLRCRPSPRSCCCDRMIVRHADDVGALLGRKGTEGGPEGIDNHGGVATAQAEARVAEVVEGPCSLQKHCSGDC